MYTLCSTTKFLISKIRRSAHHFAEEEEGAKAAACPDESAMIQSMFIMTTTGYCSNSLIATFDLVANAVHGFYAVR